jgi:hypothetical protein
MISIRTIAAREAAPNMARVKTVSLTFKGQRKAQEYVVYPAQAGDDGKLKFQSDKTCGIVDPATGACQMTTKSGYFVHLAISGFATTLDADTIAKLQDAQPKSGDSIAGVCFIA